MQRPGPACLIGMLHADVDLESAEQPSGQKGLEPLGCQLLERSSRDQPMSVIEPCDRQWVASPWWARCGCGKVHNL